MWPDAENTERLLEQARGGNVEAVNTLLSAHRDPLRRLIALRLDPALRRRVDASDIVQDVLVDANRRLPDYLQTSAMPFSLWLWHMARERLIDAHRRHRVAARRSLDREQPLAAARPDQSSLDLAAQLKDLELTPATAAMWHELEGRFHDALSRLEEKDREVICMRHFDQLSNQQVAQALGLSEPAAGMRYLRALRRLNVILGEKSNSEVGP